MLDKGVDPTWQGAFFIFDFVLGVLFFWLRWGVCGGMGGWEGGGGTAQFQKTKQKSTNTNYELNRV